MKSKKKHYIYQADYIFLDVQEDSPHRKDMLILSKNNDSGNGKVILQMTVKQILDNSELFLRFFDSFSMLENGMDIARIFKSLLTKSSMN